MIQKSEQIFMYSKLVRPNEFEPFLSQPDPIWHTALSFSAVGPILLGRRLEQKTDTKAYAAIFVVYFKSQVKKASGEDFNQFLMDI